jgi:hypothetical protein
VEFIVSEKDKARSIPKHEGSDHDPQLSRAAGSDEFGTFVIGPSVHKLRGTADSKAEGAVFSRGRERGGISRQAPQAAHQDRHRLVSFRDDVNLIQKQ